MENILHLFASPMIVSGLTLLCLLITILFRRDKYFEWKSVLLILPIVFSFLSISETSKVSDYQSFFLYFTENFVWLKFTILGFVIIFLTVLVRLQACSFSLIFKELLFAILTVIVVVIDCLLTAHYFSSNYITGDWCVLTPLLSVCGIAFLTFLLVILTLVASPAYSCVENISIKKEIVLSLLVTFLVYLITII